MATKKTPIERLFLRPWKSGPVRDYTTSPRLFTGRPKDASKAVALNLIQFLERYGIPLRAFTRHTEISGWAVRQAKAGVRSLSITQENLIKVTIERIKSGKLFLHRVGGPRWELEWITPPYKAHCPTGALYCGGGILPGSCPKHWRECGLFSTDWEAVEKIHKAATEHSKAS